MKINDLVVRFGTCRRTIRYDVEILSLTYQIGSTPGRHGGIYIDSPIHSQPRYLTPEEAETDSRRSVLLQCIGASDDVYPDMFFGDTKVNATYMLCSDGFRHEITNEEIYASLNPGVMLDADGMKRNMQSLIELNKQRQERDNISVVTIRTF